MADASVAALKAEIEGLRRALAAAQAEASAAGQQDRESEARFRAMADCAPAPTWVTNEAGIEFVNAALVEFAGLPAEQLMGEAWTRLVHPDDLVGAATRRAEAWASGEPYTFDARFRRADGEWRWLRVSSRPRLDAAGALIGYVGLAVDLTDMRRAEERLLRTSAEQAAILSQLAEGVIVADAQGRITFVNDAAARIHGVERLDVSPAAYSETYHLFTEDGRPYPSDQLPLTRAVATGEAVTDEAWRIHTPDGRNVLARGSAAPVLAEDGTRLATVLTLRDETARADAEAALRDSEARLRVTLSAGALGGWRWDAKAQTIELSEEAAALFGLPGPQTIPWEVIHPYFDPGESSQVTESVQRAVAEHRDYSAEFRARRLDGGSVWVHSVGRPVYDEAGKPTGMIGAVQDVTARHQADESLREQSRILETLNRLGSAIAAELDLQKVVQMVTDAGVALTGAQFGAFFYNVLNDEGESLMLYTLSGAEPSQFDFGMPRATAIFHPTFTGEGVVRSDDIKLDPRYGKSAPHHGMPEGHLPVSSYLAVPVISRSGEAVGGLFFGHEAAGRFNEGHEQLIVGLAAQAAIGIDNARLFQSAQREIGNRQRVERELRTLNETLEQRVVEEVAQRGQAEEALRQAQKMETLGQLTGGVAHDFNNLLQIISGNLELLMRALPDEPRLRRAAENAARGAERAAILTQRLLAFSRRQPLAPKPIEPNRLVQSMSDLLHRSLGETVKVTTRLAPDLWAVEADPHQLENAILNLAINGRDAMDGGGRITIETANARIEPGAAPPGTEIAPGDYVAITVGDTGSGMDAETLARACEPFFTTKEVGKGTGLGLSMVYGFAKQSGGDLMIESEPGIGTSVRLYLPRQAAVAAEPARSVEPPVPRARAAEIVLVCEDDDDVRAFTVDVLKELGYGVIEAADGPSALSLLRQEQRVDLLFTDVVLPGGMSGADLAGEARALRPGLKVLYTTGYARDAIVRDGRLDPGITLLSKPFAYGALAARVREMIDE